MMVIMKLFNRFLTYILYLLGVRPKEESLPPQTAQPEKPLKGTNGPIRADVLVLEENGRVIMVVDYDFLDIPEWVEWDVSRNIIGIVQMGGAIAELKSVIPPEKEAIFRSVPNILLATRFEGQRVAHSIYMVVRHEA